MPALKPSQILERAKKLLSDPDRWGKGAFYTRRHNKPSQYCVLGAVYKAANIPFNSSLYSEKTRTKLDGPLGFLEDVSLNLFNHMPATVNDNPNTTHKDILRLFDGAIKEAKRLENSGV